MREPWRIGLAVAAVAVAVVAAWTSWQPQRAVAEGSDALGTAEALHFDAGARADRPAPSGTNPLSVDLLFQQAAIERADGDTAGARSDPAGGRAQASPPTRPPGWRWPSSSSARAASRRRSRPSARRSTSTRARRRRSRPTCRPAAASRAVRPSACDAEARRVQAAAGAPHVDRRRSPRRRARARRVRALKKRRWSARGSKWRVGRDDEARRATAWSRAASRPSAARGAPRPAGRRRRPRARAPRPPTRRRRRPRRRAAARPPRAAPPRRRGARARARRSASPATSAMVTTQPASQQLGGEGAVAAAEVEHALARPPRARAGSRAAPRSARARRPRERRATPRLASPASGVGGYPGTLP